MTNHVDRFYAALAVLAGHGHIKQRLITAYEEHLVGIDEDEIPIAIKQAYADLRQSMHRCSPHNGESPVCASVRKMSVEEASECASMVVALYSEIARSRDDADISLPISEESVTVVPPFLIKSV